MSERLRVDRIACTGHGVCAELLPEAVALDEWGYPLVAAGDLPRDLHRPARRAVAACPARALLLERTEARQPLPGRFTGSAQGRVPQ
ncbi:ferredoxin [Klenkia sp. PcliD-1-E]|uniref:ferredoxin n=1 Tax=Klenkia sp. PcliD-1-E TaxID=2954492 RepID=UPI002096EB9A|nr:ferredoxin [Klenkia sp. PcliD-1-E]MCO7220952.1 ferredoxin [Klenkia sp. PcliD-1-E]